MARLYLRGTLAARFWPRVRRNGPTVRSDLGPCWLFKGSRQRGQVAVRQEDGRYRMKLAHRVAWELEKGPIADGVQILHRCDIQGCCRPSHLYEGGYAENAEDCSSRLGRGGKVVTREMVQLIRERHAQGISQYRLAKEFSLSDSTINSIVNRKTWRHV